MLEKMLNNISEKNQGYLALLGGLLLLLGVAGKIEMLESMLNTIITVVAIVLLAWGVQKSNVIHQLKQLRK